MARSNRCAAPRPRASKRWVTSGRCCVTDGPRAGCTMNTIEERVQQIVTAYWGDRPTMIYRLAHELQQLRAALPTPAYLESVATQLEMTCVQEMALPDGT